MVPIPLTHDAASYNPPNQVLFMNTNINYKLLTQRESNPQSSRYERAALTNYAIGQFFKEHSLYDKFKTKFQDVQFFFVDRTGLEPVTLIV